MQYSTLQEAYNIGTFKQPTIKKRSCSQPNNNQQLYSIENSSLASNKESIDYSNYDNNSKNTGNPNNRPGNANNVSNASIAGIAGNAGNVSNVSNASNANNTNNIKNSIAGGGNCSPLQAPMYTIPVSGDCKKERDEAIKTYTDENARNNDIEKYNNYTNNVEMSINNSSDNIRPFYDEDMEQYFDINNLKDEVNYKSNSDIKINDYMPNYNKKSYTNNNTNEYSNNNVNSKNGINLLNNNEYNLSEEEKIKAKEALDYLKSIEDKINNNDVATLDAVKPPELTGPGGFIVKKTLEENTLKSQNAQMRKEEVQLPTTIHDAKLIESINENKKTQNIFNMLINIFIFVFIGILIILLCDYIAEIAIQIGSTKTANTLEPYIKYHMIYMQNMANNNAVMMQNMQGGVNTMPAMPSMTNIPGTLPIPGMQVVQNIPYPIMKS
jgi:hypothetical protein